MTTLFKFILIYIPAFMMWIAIISELLGYEL